MCLAVTCHLHFWQDDRDLLRATAVTRGWNGYRNKSQHRKLSLENKILPPLLSCRGLEPATFQSRVRRSNHSAIPAPQPSHKIITRRTTTTITTTTKNRDSNTKISVCRLGSSKHAHEHSFTHMHLHTLSPVPGRTMSDTKPVKI